MSVLIVGSIALDSIETPLAKCKEVLGGSAAYASMSAQLFSPVKLVAVVGSDFPEKHIRFFKKRYIDTEGVEIKTGKTFRWRGRYGWDFNDPVTLSTHLNVFADFDPKLPSSYKDCKYIFLANIDPRIQMKVLKQIRAPKLIVCDTMNFWITNARKELLRLLKKVDMFLLNESEARELSGKTNLLAAAGAIRELGPKKVVIKRGEHGAILFSGHKIFCTPALLMESIYDPTGAGDTFAGGMIGYLARQKTLRAVDFRRGVVYGSVLATFAVESFSLTRLGAITQRDITRRFAAFRKQTCF